MQMVIMDAALTVPLPPIFYSPPLSASSPPTPPNPQYFYFSPKTSSVSFQLIL